MLTRQPSADSDESRLLLGVETSTPSLSKTNMAILDVRISLHGGSTQRAPLNQREGGLGIVQSMILSMRLSDRRDHPHEGSKQRQRCFVSQNICSRFHLTLSGRVDRSDNTAGRQKSVILGHHRTHALRSSLQDIERRQTSSSKDVLQAE